MFLFWLLQFGEIWDRNKGEYRTSLSHLIVFLCVRFWLFPGSHGLASWGPRWLAFAWVLSTLGASPRQSCGRSSPERSYPCEHPSRLHPGLLIQQLPSCTENGKLTPTRPPCLSSLSPRTEVVSCPNGCDFFPMSLFLLNSDGDRVRPLHIRGQSWKRNSGIPFLQAPLLAFRRALLAGPQPPYLALLLLNGDRCVLGGVDEKPVASLSSTLTKATSQCCWFPTSLPRCRLLLDSTREGKGRAWSGWPLRAAQPAPCPIVSLKEVTVPAVSSVASLPQYWGPNA